MKNLCITVRCNSSAPNRAHGGGSPPFANCVITCNLRKSNSNHRNATEGNACQLCKTCLKLTPSRCSTWLPVNKLIKTVFQTDSTTMSDPGSNQKSQMKSDGLLANRETTAHIKKKKKRASLFSLKQRYANSYGH